ncbi:MAG: UvrD-helicase domain-containing protein, partial [Bacillota bacterium]|nr:UvrD-helicase domain-containing protein [Bacillota bacterium]
DVVMAVLDAASRYRVRLGEAQREQNMFGFDDITAFAIHLLETEETVRARYRRDVVEIMVDEYQDTNDAQDRLVDLLSAGSVFMVGDVKQSIYGFRNANPKNFLRKCREVARGSGGEVISLQDNFRSRPGVLSTVNTLFERVMDESLGGVDYKDGHSLRPAREDLFLPTTLDDTPEIIVYDPGDRPAVAVEAELLVSIVAREMTNQTPVSEKADGKLIHRNCRYGDFCVLVDRKTDFAVYRRAFTVAGIPVFAVTDEKFVASAEILFVLSVLRLVRAAADPGYAKDWFRHALFGAARSFVFAVSDDLVLPIVADRSNIRFPSSGLPAELGELADLVQTLAKAAPRLTAETFLARLYELTDIYRHAASLPDPAAAEAKLDFLLEKAATLPLAGFSGLFDYIEGIATSKDLDVEFARPLDLSVDAVVLMTMHKAKGLEFPFCLYPGLSKRFNRADTRGFFLFDRRFGLITKAFDAGFKDTFVHALYREALDRDLISERIRLFYVALTRAREKQFLLLDGSKDDGVRPEPGSGGYLPDRIRLGYDSYADLVRSVSALDRWRVAPPPLPAPIDRREPEKRSIEPADVVTFDFPAVVMAPRIYAKGTVGSVDEAAKNAIATGVRFHELLEQFEFRAPAASLQRLDPIWRSRLERFLAHPELARIASSTVYRELDFVDGAGPDAGRGTIDLLFIDASGASIVDYKLKHIDDPAYRDQLAGYAAYVEKTTQLPVKTYLYSILDDRLVETGG